MPARMSSPRSRTLSPGAYGRARDDLALTGIDVLLGDHRGGPGGDRRAGRDADRLALAEGLERGRARAGLADNAQPALGGTGENRVAVHRRAREGRYVAGGLKVHGQHPVDGLADLDGLGAQRLDGSEHELAGLGDRK